LASNIWSAKAMTTDFRLSEKLENEILKEAGE